MRMSSVNNKTKQKKVTRVEAGLASQRATMKKKIINEFANSKGKTKTLMKKVNLSRKKLVPIKQELSISQMREVKNTERRNANKASRKAKRKAAWVSIAKTNRVLIIMTPTLN